MSLYKYLMPDRVDVLKNRSIRFTQHMALNDPFEMKPFFELLAEDAIMKQLFCFGGEDTWNAGFDMGYSLITMVFDEMKKHFPDEASKHEIDKIWNGLPSYQSLKEQTKQEQPEFLDGLVELAKQRMPELRNVIFTSFNESIGVLSLTQKCDDILMWAHYAQNNKGFVIEFDDSHEFFNQPMDSGGLSGCLHKVVYSEDRPNRDSMLDMSPSDIFLLKSEKWKDEEEWRMLQSLENGQMLEKDGVAILDDEGQPIYLFSLPPSCITGVIFGSRMSQENKSKIMHVLSTDDYSHVKKYQAVLDDRKFKLNIIPHGET
jgi:Protein of unknown function (DUF2971)